MQVMRLLNSGSMLRNLTDGLPAGPDAAEVNRIHIDLVKVPTFRQVSAPASFTCLSVWRLIF